MLGERAPHAPRLSRQLEDLRALVGDLRHVCALVVFLEEEHEGTGGAGWRLVFCC